MTASRSRKSADDTLEPLQALPKTASANLAEAIAFFEVARSVTRLQILCALGSRQDSSPSELASELGCDLARLSYHFRRLKSAGAIELTRTATRRGAIEHYYALTGLGDALVRAVTALSRNRAAATGADSRRARPPKPSAVSGGKVSVSANGSREAAPC